MLTGWREPPCSHPGLQRRYYLQDRPAREALAARAWEIHGENPGWSAARCWEKALDEAATATREASC